MKSLVKLLVSVKEAKDIIEFKPSCVPIVFTLDTRTGRRDSTTTAKMSSAVLCTSGMTGENGMTTIVINHLATSARDVSISAVGFC